MQRIYERTIQIFSLQIKNACIMQTKPGAISDMVVLIKIYCLNQCTRKNMIVCRSIAISICHIKLLKPHQMILISKLFSIMMSLDYRIRKEKISAIFVNKFLLIDCNCEKYLSIFLVYRYCYQPKAKNLFARMI